MGNLCSSATKEQTDIIPVGNITRTVKTKVKNYFLVTFRTYSHSQIC